MKKTIRIISIVSISCAILSGCQLEKKLLTVEQIGKATIETFFSTLEGVESAGQGLHKELRTFVDKTYIRYGDIRGDLLNITLTADEGEILTFNYELTAEHVATYPRYLWAAGWVVVSSANYIIEYGGKLRESSEYQLGSELARIDAVLAQAYFARAFAHFAICNCYAWPYNHTSNHSHIGIPVMNHVPGFDEKVERKSVAAVYDQILSDITKARETFAKAAEEDPSAAQKNCQINSISDCYHISDIACEALQARVYLYMEDWAKAEKCARNVMDKIQLTPRDKYIAMYRSSQANHGTEAILLMDSYNSTTSMASCYDVSRSNGCDYIPDPSVYGLFPDDDIRKELLTYVPLPTEDIYREGLTFNCVTKYLYDRTITDPALQCHDSFVFRGSEMYLIHAEACVKGRSDIATALEDVKALEARALGKEATLTASGEKEMLDLIELERKKELCYEGHRFFDILRQKQDLKRPKSSNSKIKSLKYGDYRFILPIDRMECQYNEFMKQNEGYDDYKPGSDGTDTETPEETEEP